MDHYKIGFKEYFRDIIDLSSSFTIVISKICDFAKVCSFISSSCLQRVELMIVKDINIKLSKIKKTESQEFITLHNMDISLQQYRQVMNILSQYAKQDLKTIKSLIIENFDSFVFSPKSFETFFEVANICVNLNIKGSCILMKPFIAKNTHNSDKI